MIRKVFGLVGPIASGKGTVVKILVEQGYTAYSLSDRIREEIRRQGLDITRETLNTVSNELRETLGADILARRTAQLIEKENPEFVAIDAIRNPAEVNFLKEKFGIKIIGIVADQKRRFELFKNRGNNAAGIETFEQFKELDDRELVQEGQHKQQINECLKLADIIIENNGTIEDLKQKVQEFIGPLA